MRLFFDQGGLVLSEAPDLDLRCVAGLYWDPRVALWRAPAHRYAELVAALKQRGLPFLDSVEAERERLANATRHWRTLDLRPYQHAALTAWELSGSRGLVVLPTGAGKTRLALAAMAHFNQRTLCLVPTRSLLQQWRGELSMVYPGAIGCLGDGEHELARVTVATFDSALRYMPSWGASFELLVVDEAHHFGGKKRDAALEMCTAAARLGLTATPPDAWALSRLEDSLGPVVYQQTLVDLAGTWLSAFELQVLRLSLNESERHQYQQHHGLFRRHYHQFKRRHPSASWSEFATAASTSPEGRLALHGWRCARRLLSYTAAKAEAVGHLLARHDQQKMLIFTANNQATYSISREHLIPPITCEIPRAERERTLQAFRDGELRQLVSTRVLNEGIDVPDAEVAIIVGGTRGEREQLQRVGRLLRPKPGKRAIIYELVTRATSETHQARQRSQGLAAARALSA